MHAGRVTEAGRQRGTGLRYGWTTGACATAAATAAYTALLTGEFPDPVAIDLPRDKHPAFALALGRIAWQREPYLINEAPRSASLRKPSKAVGARHNRGRPGCFAVIRQHLVERRTRAHR